MFCLPAPLGKVGPVLTHRISYSALLLPGKERVEQVTEGSSRVFCSLLPWHTWKKVWHNWPQYFRLKQICSSTLLRSCLERLSRVKRTRSTSGKRDRNFLSNIFCVVPEVRNWRPRRFQKMCFFPAWHTTWLSSWPNLLLCPTQLKCIQWMTNCVHALQTVKLYHREMMGLERSFISHDFQGRALRVGNTKSMFPPQGLSAVT